MLLTNIKEKVLDCRIIFTLLIIAQAGYWYQVKAIRPELGIVPNVPSEQTVSAMSFGDKQFYFRLLAFELQNAGDTFGRSTSLRYYDFNKLFHWFKLMDSIDSKSNMIPSMATYYFSQTQNRSDVRYVVDYLYDHATRDIKHKWWWLVQSIYLSTHRLDDKDLALKVAKPLVNDGVPVWAQQMVAVVHEKRGEMQDALRIMETIKNNASDIKDSDLKYMTYFIKERLGKLDELEEKNKKLIDKKPQNKNMEK
ncbi:MAG: hypothetical protein R3D71_10765 [Rickettsiales bacterium]